jgi:hypothetical protein
MYNYCLRGCGGMVDTHALGACAERREGSSPFIPTIMHMVILHTLPVVSDY